MKFSQEEIDHIKNKIKNKTILNKSTGCLEYKGYLQEGYSKIWYNKKTYRGHRLAWMIYHNKAIPPNKVIMHACDNRSCLSKEHLILGTHKDNCNDKVKKNRHNVPKGENCNFAKLTKSDVRQIKILFEIGDYKSKKQMYDRIANMFNVSATCIKFIYLRKTWNHIV